jgi:hypothetical protein
LPIITNNVKKSAHFGAGFITSGLKKYSENKKGQESLAPVLLRKGT